MVLWSEIIKQIIYKQIYIYYYYSIISIHRLLLALISADIERYDLRFDVSFGC